MSAKWKDRITKWVKLIAVLLLCAVLWPHRPWRLHKEISAREVARVELRPAGALEGQSATPEAARQIIDWFNVATDVTESYGSPGCGTYSNITIHLRSGEQVRVVSYMQVQRGNTEYYFKQPELQQFIEGLDQRLAAGASKPGC